MPDNFLTDEKKTRSNSDVIIQENHVNSTDRAYEQPGSFKLNRVKKEHFYLGSERNSWNF